MTLIPSPRLEIVDADEQLPIVRPQPHSPNLPSGSEARKAVTVALSSARWSLP